jgi:hypothetical protein
VNFFRLKFKKKKKKNQIQILDTRHTLSSSKLQFEIYLVPTKPLVVPENLRILMGRTVSRLKKWSMKKCGQQSFGLSNDDRQY